MATEKSSTRARGPAMEQNGKNYEPPLLLPARIRARDPPHFADLSFSPASPLQRAPYVLSLFGRMPSERTHARTHARLRIGYF